MSVLDPIPLTPRQDNMADVVMGARSTSTLSISLKVGLCQ